MKITFALYLVKLKLNDNGVNEPSFKKLDFKC